MSENFKFEFTDDEYELLCKKAMLNEELATIFYMKIHGCSIVEISLKLKYSERTINRRIKKLKSKIKRAL